MRRGGERKMRRARPGGDEARDETGISFMAVVAGWAGLVGAVARRAERINGGKGNAELCRSGCGGSVIWSCQRWGGPARRQRMKQNWKGFIGVAVMETVRWGRVVAGVGLLGCEGWWWRSRVLRD
jgi:hypothetical protein